MLNRLSIVLAELPKLIKQGTWTSLVINRRKPHTYRASTMFDGRRVCLQRFEPCTEDEAFPHPHGWAAAFVVLEGHYRQQVWLAQSRKTKPRRLVMTILLGPGSSYEIVNPMTWHSIQPIIMDGYAYPPEFPPSVYTVMVNDAPWDADSVHDEVRTTVGKDLDEMSPIMLAMHLKVFERLVS